jgi:DNA polymerase-4
VEPYRDPVSYSEENTFSRNRSRPGRPRSDGPGARRGSGAARSLLARAELDDAVRLLGVGVTNLVPAANDQMELFGGPDDRARSTRLNRALDEIAERFGAKAVARGELAEVERAGLSLQIKRGESPD